MAAINRLEVLDQSLLLIGRFDRQIAVSAPDLAGRMHNQHSRQASACRKSRRIDQIEPVSDHS
jgi:ATP-dependent Zn protease